MATPFMQTANVNLVIEGNTPGVKHFAALDNANAPIDLSSGYTFLLMCTELQSFIPNNQASQKVQDMTSHATFTGDATGVVVSWTQAQSLLLGPSVLNGTFELYASNDSGTTFAKLAKGSLSAAGYLA